MSCTRERGVVTRRVSKWSVYGRTGTKLAALLTVLGAFAAVGSSVILTLAATGHRAPHGGDRLFLICALISGVILLLSGVGMFRDSIRPAHRGSVDRVARAVAREAVALRSSSCSCAARGQSRNGCRTQSPHFAAMAELVRDPV